MRELALTLLAFMRKHEALYSGPCPCGLCWHGVIALSQFTGGSISLSLDEFERALPAATAPTEAPAQ